jgi:electron transfer flavoprotein-quinone oxidoreductase
MPESAEPDFEVIVIGAGVAGCVTAYQLARQGRSVLLIERGEAPGSKNLSGGVLYSRGIQQVFPDFLAEAPVERRITRNYISFLNAESSVAIDYKDARLAEPVNAVTVLRAKLDPWLAAKCEEAGALIMPGVRVDRVLTEDGPAGQRVVGVQAGEDELRARVVVAADGVNSFIAKEAGLRQNDPLNHLAVGVKSVVSLPRETIEARFNLTGDEGAAIAAVGDCTEGVGAAAFSIPTSTPYPSAWSCAWTISPPRGRSSPTSSTTSLSTGSLPRTSRAGNWPSTAAIWSPRAA